MYAAGASAGPAASTAAPTSATTRDTAGGKPVEHVPIADMIESGMKNRIAADLRTFLNPITM